MDRSVKKDEVKPIWLEQLAELKKEYQLQELKFAFRERTVELVKVTDINTLLDRVVNADEIPFWADLWPASIALAEFIFDNQNLFSGKNVLELGSGVGLAGIAAKINGAKVTQSDFCAEAFRFIRLNCLRNNVPVEPLLLADWRSFPKDIEKFDYIIGSDILYEKDLHTNLRGIFKDVLKPDGLVLLADPGRNYGKQFVEKLTQSGWTAKQEQVKLQYEEKIYHIDIYQLSFQGNH